MKLKLLTTCHNDGMPGYRRLKASLDKHGWDYQCLVRPFKFGHQLPIIREWCGDATHIVYVDAFDNICFSSPEEVIEKFKKLSTVTYHGDLNPYYQECKMIISTEKACYPHPERSGEYPKAPTPWAFVNGGGWMVEVDYFKHLCQKENLNDQSHDQVWLMDAFLRNQQDIKLDYYCEIFNTIAFSHPSEWSEVVDKKGNKRFWNQRTQSLPVFFHGNGHTEMDWLE